MKRKSLIAGNWKMHMTQAEANHLAKGILAHVDNTRTDREVLLAPPFTALSGVAKTLQGSTILLAGQNVCWEKQGAFTGEISPSMLHDVGATFVIVGHSERRQIFQESDEMINRRLKGALASGLQGILCIGETLAEREAEKTFAVLGDQLCRGLSEIDGSTMKDVVIAYEPVWAIGTGKTASKEQAQDAHSFIRNKIEKIFEKSIAEDIRILYGGSVKPTNVDELMSQPDIDGALVGGAALDAESFGRIINYEL